jgi:lycopene beta-cyclase
MSHFDRVIIGAGLSGLSLADRWRENGVLRADEKVALIDTNYESIKERTFAFWRSKATTQFRYASLIENRWERFRVTPPSTARGIPDSSLSFGDFVYEKISGAGFYSHVLPKIAGDPRFTMLQDFVVDLEESSNQIKIKLQSNLEITATEVWSSATEEAVQPVLQHFLGYEIETEVDVFTLNVADLMDYRTKQLGEVRFLYVLPFSTRSALVEFTVFSTRLLKVEEYETALKTYIAEELRLDHYRITRVEHGVIPMVLETMPKFSGSRLGSRIHPIGAAAGLIKASTGYSFIRNQNFLDAGGKTATHAAWRFSIYDSLLLGIIRNNGARLAEILPHLFATNPPDRVFRFLAEESHFSEEIQIFYGLPWWPFIKNLVTEYPFIFALGLTAAIFPVHHLVVPLLGVFLFGISHGSRDHRLFRQGSLLLFFVKYLVGVALFIAIWWFSPSAALMLFLALSVEHFGVCQFARALKLSSGSLSFRFLALSWGAFAALAAPLLHWNEALLILKSILRNSNALSDIPSTYPLMVGLILALLALFAAARFDRYELEVTARSRTAFWSTCLLIITFASLPLLAGFLCFFSFWHSIDSIRQQQKKNNLDLQKYFQEVCLISLISWLGLAGLFWWVGLNWGIFFVALGAVTLPHATLMQTFYDFKKKKA